MLNFILQKGDIRGDMVPPSIDSGQSIGDGLLPSAILRVGCSLYSPGGGFRLMFQEDQNVVLQCLTNPPPRIWLEGVPFEPPAATAWTPLWATGTNGQGTTQLCMQSDGNLVVYSGSSVLDGNGVLPSNTSGNQGAFLRMQDDGNLVIYSSDGAALWSSNTNAQSQL